jgi:DNA-binding NarL/FixJ family response regulator
MSNRAILCVDDEQIVLWNLRDQIIRNFGDSFLYEVAESADEAWEVIEELYQERIQILIIISDWLMPGTKGDEFLIEVHRRFPDVVTIMLTGQADAGAVERTYKFANLHAYISKPWNESDLVNFIKSGVNKFNDND